MGNKYHIKVPTLNENLSKLNIREIVLGEFHCAAIDYKKNLYTWGENYYGQVGCFNKENNNEKDNNNINLPSKVVINNEGNNNLKVLKVECGKYFTIGISNEGFVFKIGGKYNNNEEEKQNNNNNIQFLNYFKEIEEYDENNNNNKLNFDIENSIYSKVNEIYCNEEIISFINQNGDLFLFSENQGLFHVISKYKFNKIKFINRLFYGINNTNDILFEFINYSNNNNEINLFDYVQNEYEINKKVKINFINLPYYVKALFMDIKCLEKDKNKFEDFEENIFFKKKFQWNYNNNNKSNVSYYTVNNNNNKNNKINKISNMLENIFEKKIDDYVYKNKIADYSDINNNKHFFFGKKRIKLEKIDFKYEYNIIENLNFYDILDKKSLFYNNNNNDNNILNIPISLKYKNDNNSSRKNIFNNKYFNDEDAYNNNNYNDYNNNFSSYKNNLNNKFNENDGLNKIENELKKIENERIKNNKNNELKRLENEKNEEEQKLKNYLKEKESKEKEKKKD